MYLLGCSILENLFVQMALFIGFNCGVTLIRLLVSGWRFFMFLAGVQRGIHLCKWHSIEI